MSNFRTLKSQPVASVTFPQLSMQFGFPGRSSASRGLLFKSPMSPLRGTLSDNAFGNVWELSGHLKS
eukprot:7381131-Pyramimonas_sp.AAC.1